MKPLSAQAAFSCHVCGARGLELAPAYGRFQRVTSDCKPWPDGGTLACCKVCGSVQAVVTPQWRAEAAAIYAEYTIYHQGAGAEQRVFAGGGGGGEPRSDRLVARFRKAFELPGQGRLLDIGCGNGSFLSAWSRAFPGWTLRGTEMDTKHQAQLERIPGFYGLVTGDWTALEERFDLISLVHVLEHIPDPVDCLERCREKLRPEGFLLVEVPDCRQNPFMLLVADHCSHFAPALLAEVVAAAGFDVSVVTDQWVAKEISLLARARTGPFERGEVCGSPADSEAVFNGWRPIEGIRSKVLQLAQQRPFGLFGTAIAATWLDAELRGAADFFVDEDATRTGRTHLGRPILAPGEVPPGATIFVALPEPLAGQVTERLACLEKGLRIEQP